MLISTLILYDVLIIDHLPGQLFYDVLMTHLVPGSKHLQFIGRHKFLAPKGQFTHLTAKPLLMQSPSWI